MLWNLSRTIVTGSAMLLLSGPMAAAQSAAAPSETPLRAAAAGQHVTTAEGEGAEAVRLDPAVASSLLELAPGSSLPVADWPVAPGIRREVELVRFDVYAPGARIVKIEDGQAIEVPRSRLVFFQGYSPEDPGTRLVVSIDPDTRVLAGTAFTGKGTHELRPSEDTAGDHLVAALAEPQEKDGGPSWSCGQQQDPVTGSPLSALFSAAALGTVPKAGITSLHTAVIAVDTDNELMSLKFGNNSTAATNYIANLIARMNVMYERDLLVRLVQGLTILRPSTTADPYVQGPGVPGCASCTNGNQLSEFSNYWSAGCGGACTGAGASRTLAMMLSGKQSSSFSASGVAWLDTLCSTSLGYSFTQVFKFAQDTSANDASLVGHEIGHNFGSPHTHCYSPPVDTCFNGEACYTGSTSCPAPATYNGVPNVTGTVMSYCHLTGCGSSEVFHTRTVDLLDDKIMARVGQCIQPLGPPNSIFSNGFEGGNLTSWQ